MRAESCFGKSESQLCAAETPLQLNHLCPLSFLSFFFFQGGLMYSTTTRPLLFFLSWTHLSLPLTLWVIYVCLQLLDVRKLFPEVSPGFVSLPHVCVCVAAAAAAAASRSSGRPPDVWPLVYLPEAQEEPSNDCSRRVISCRRSPLRPARANVFFLPRRPSFHDVLLPAVREAAERHWPGGGASKSSRSSWVAQSVAHGDIPTHPPGRSRSAVSEWEHLVGGAGRGRAHAT